MNVEKMGKFISKLRKNKGLTQEELAELLMTSSKTVSRWECGKSAPDIEIITKLCEVLDITPTELFSCRKEENVEKKDKSVKYDNYVFQGVNDYIDDSKKQSERRGMEIIIISMIFLIIMSIFLYVFNNYNKLNHRLIELSYNMYTVNGFFIYNHSEGYIGINNISYDGDINISSVDTALYCGTNLLERKGFSDITEDENTSLDFWLNKESLYIEIDQDEFKCDYEDYKKLELVITYVDIDTDVKYIERITLNN